MGRPKVPLIERSEAIAKALEIIDKEGIDALSIRRLGLELGVNGASLYHHFADKEEILTEVRRLVLQKLRVPESHDVPWQEFVVDAAKAFRQALVRHPNTIPLMIPGESRPWGLSMRDFACEVVLKAGVAKKYAYAITSSTETLAFGAALINPTQQEPRQILGAAVQHKNLMAAIKADQMTQEERFNLEVRALVEGWSVIVGDHDALRQPPKTTLRATKAARAATKG